MVKVRTAIEKTYSGVCSIFAKEKIRKENHSTAFAEVAVLENQPCRFSFSSKKPTDFQGVAMGVSLEGVLFLAPEIQVLPSSKIQVTQNGRTTYFAKAGESALYPTHQEIPLSLFQEYA